MKLTTKDIIHILPFEQAFQEKLLADFDTLSADQKFNIEQAVWDAYAAMYDFTLDKNLSVALEKVKEGTETIDKDFYKRVNERTDQEMQNLTTKNVESADLAEARKAMEMIINEIRASKKK